MSSSLCFILLTSFLFFEPTSTSVILTSTRGKRDQKLVCPCGHGVTAMEHKEFAVHDPNITITCEDIGVCNETCHWKNKCDDNERPDERVYLGGIWSKYNEKINKTSLFPYCCTANVTVSHCLQKMHSSTVPYKIDYTPKKFIHNVTAAHGQVEIVHMCNFNGTNQKNCSCERIAGAVPVPVVVVVIAGPAGLGAAATPCGCAAENGVCTPGCAAEPGFVCSLNCALSGPCCDLLSTSLICDSC